MQLNCQRRDTNDRHIAGLRIVVHENYLAGMRVDGFDILLACPVDSGTRQ